VGKRRPGGKVLPAMAEDLSWMAKPVSGNGEKTSSSRLTSVNCWCSVGQLEIEYKMKIGINCDS
jgi:hypothetical protein